MKHPTLLVVLFWLAGYLPAIALAGGGAERLVLVVNADSPTSKLIANYYISVREIPAINVIYLSGIPDTETIGLDEFRDLILKPVMAQIQNKRLGSTIDYIVYSADFPTAVDVSPHLKLLAELASENSDQPFNRRVYSPVASINSLTFFAAAVLSDQPGYMLLNSNNYYRQPASMLLRNPFVGKLQSEFNAAVENLKSDSEDQWRQSARTLESMAAANPRQLAVVYELARAFGKLGDARKSANWLGRAVKLGWKFQTQTLADRIFDPVKDDPLFAGIVQRMPDEPFDFVPTSGFHSAMAYGPNGMPNGTPGQGNLHVLSTVLAATRGFGNSEREALAQLQRTMRADGTLPHGTFYYCQTKDVRSTTRQPEFAAAVAALKRMGQAAEVVTTSLPVDDRDVLGVTCGAANFNWILSGSKFVPGAIGDNLTSYGGRLQVAGQTKLTEFLNQGAAGASGAVVEPYAIGAKFPHPMVHVHYARGCSLAEAFYQSVQGPMQLLIVGDALCRPFARLPQVVAQLEPGQTLTGISRIELVNQDTSIAIRQLQLFVDGRLVHQQPHLEPISLDTNSLTDGFHEFRVVATAVDDVDTTNHWAGMIQVDNQGGEVSLEAEHPDYLETDRIRLTAKSNCGDAVLLVHNGRLVAKQAGREVSFEIPATLLGRGPVRLEAVAIDSARPVDADVPDSTQPALRSVASPPLTLRVEGRLRERPRQLDQPRTANEK